MVESANSWSEDFAAQLRSSGVEKFCVSIDLDFDEVFLAPARNSSLKKNPYDDFQWVVYPYSLISTGVLHSFSNDAQLRKELPWEEWLQWEGESRHASLYQVRQNPDQGVFDGSLEDKEHPPILLGQECFSYASIFSYARERVLKAIVVFKPATKAEFMDVAMYTCLIKL
jgi:hypothetical protein